MMATDATQPGSGFRRILGRLTPENFVGRSDDLRALTDLALPAHETRGLIMLAAPAAGVSELLRQAYDRLFRQRGGATPIYFAWSRQDQTTATAVRRFLHTFLTQLVAHRRDDPALVHAPPPLRDLIDLAAPQDYEWIERLIEIFERTRDGQDERALVRLCLSAPHAAAARGARTVLLFDDVQQFAASPFYLSLFVQAAQREASALTSFLDCQQLYVDELFGGRIHRRLNAILEEIAPELSERRALIRLLQELAQSGNNKSPAEAWRKRLDVEPDELFRLLTGLHGHELASFNATYVELSTDTVWRDYLRASYRLQVAAEPRALVVAETLVETLKRAPQTMARHYRRETALGLRDLLARFNYQRVA